LTTRTSDRLFVAEPRAVPAADATIHQLGMAMRRRRKKRRRRRRRRRR
jgi:hypothetical protein